MCSTPKAKQKIKGKTSNNVVSFLSQMNVEQRKLFTERANAASERREIEEQKAILDQTQIEQTIDQASLKENVMTSHPWHYWLTSASFSEIFRTLFHKKPSMK